MRADALWVKPIVAINERRKAVAMAPSARGGIAIVGASRITLHLWSLFMV
jgi:hypothetical protein